MAHIDPIIAPTQIVALHCSGGSPAQWEQLRIMQEGARVLLAPRLLASAQLTGNEEGTFRLYDEAARILSRITDAGGPVHLVGHSYGGAVALNLAARAPERLKSVCLYEPSAFHLFDSENARGSAALADLAQISERITAAISAGDPTGAARLLVEYWSGSHVWDALSEGAKEKVRGYLPKAQAEFSAMLAEPFATRAYARTGLPFLILKGERSANPASLAGELLADAIPNATSVKIPDAGHMGPITHPEQVATAISDFVATVDAAATRPAA